MKAQQSRRGAARRTRRSCFVHSHWLRSLERQPLAGGLPSFRKMPGKSSTLEDEEDEVELPQSELDRLERVLPEGVPIAANGGLVRQPSGGDFAEGNSMKLTNKEKFEASSLSFRPASHIRCSDHPWCVLKLAVRIHFSRK